MLKNLFIVGLGSFVGGAARYAVSKCLQSTTLLALPWGTFAVNIIGCLAIGFVCGLDNNGSLPPQAKLFLTTGFCGGFTTFSTFMNENASLMNDKNGMALSLYLFGSIALGLAAVVAGHQLGKALSGQ